MFDRFFPFWHFNFVLFLCQEERPTNHAGQIQSPTCVSRPKSANPIIVKHTMPNNSFSATYILWFSEKNMFQLVLYESGKHTKSHGILNLRNQNWSHKQPKSRLSSQNNPFLFTRKTLFRHFMWSDCFKNISQDLWASFMWKLLLNKILSKDFYCANAEL